MTARHVFRCLLAFPLLLVALQPVAAQDELRETFFKSADEALAVAREADAEFLAPRSFEKGQKAYAAAEQALERGRNIDSVRSRTAEAAQSFTEATRAAELAKTALAQALKSRQDGANADAASLSKPLWDDAQETLGEAIRYLERGDLKAAKNKDKS